MKILISSLSKTSLLYCLLFFSNHLASAQVNSKETLRKEFIQLIDRPKTALNPFVKIDSSSDLITEKGYIYSESTEKVPFLIYKQKVKSTEKRPVVICLHGTGGTKEGMKNILAKFSSLGFIAIAIDARFHGERRENVVGKTQYIQAIVKAWQSKDLENPTFPLYYDTVYDLSQLTEYLKTRNDVDPQRIGMMGISMGGIEAWLAASINPDIKVTVPIISVQSFKWSLEHDRWKGRVGSIQEAHDQVVKDLHQQEVNKSNIALFWNKLIPGISDRFDCPSMLPLIAPRPLLVLNTENDPNCPLPGAEIAIRAAQKEYKRLKQEDKFKADIAPKELHTFVDYQAEMMYAFFKKWL